MQDSHSETDQEASLLDKNREEGGYTKQILNRERKIWTKRRNGQKDEIILAIKPIG